MGAFDPPDPRYPSITCPQCGATSYNLNDIRWGWCGNCREYTGPDAGVAPLEFKHRYGGEDVTACGHAMPYRVDVYHLKPCPTCFPKERV